MTFDEYKEQYEKLRTEQDAELSVLDDTISELSLERMRKQNEWRQKHELLKQEYNKTAPYQIGDRFLIKELGKTPQVFQIIKIIPSVWHGDFAYECARHLSNGEWSAKSRTLYDVDNMADCTPIKSEVETQSL